MQLFYLCTIIVRSTVHLHGNRSSERYLLGDFLLAHFMLSDRTKVLWAKRFGPLYSDYFLLEEQ